MMLPDGFRIRRGSAADLDLVVRHRVEMFRDMGFTGEALVEAERSGREYFAAQFAEERYYAWFLEDPEGQVIAGAGITISRYHPSPKHPAPFRAWVVNVYTEPEHRRRGFARELMETVIGWGRAQKYQSIFLHASEQGRPLYEDMGFVRINEMRLDLE